MTPANFAAFLALCKERHGWTASETAEALGLSKNMLGPKHYGRPDAKIPRYIALACAAVDAGLEPFKAPAAVTPPDA